jgi:hypothetical protein
MRQVPSAPPSAAATLTNAGYAGSPSCSAWTSDSMPVSSPRRDQLREHTWPRGQAAQVEEARGPGRLDEHPLILRLEVVGRVEQLPDARLRADRAPVAGGDLQLRRQLDRQQRRQVPEAPLLALHRQLGLRVLELDPHQSDRRDAEHRPEDQHEAADPYTAALGGGEGSSGHGASSARVSRFVPAFAIHAPHRNTRHTRECRPGQTAGVATGEAPSERWDFLPADARQAEIFSNISNILQTPALHV